MRREEKHCLLDKTDVSFVSCVGFLGWDTAQILVARGGWGSMLDGVCSSGSCAFFSMSEKAPNFDSC